MRKPSVKIKCEYCLVNLTKEHIEINKLCTLRNATDLHDSYSELVQVCHQQKLHQACCFHRVANQICCKVLKRNASNLWIKKLTINLHQASRQLTEDIKRCDEIPFQSPPKQCDEIPQRFLPQTPPICIHALLCFVAVCTQLLWSRSVFLWSPYNSQWPKAKTG